MRENVTMTEIQPQLTYSPNGVLEIQSDFSRMTEEMIINAANAIGELTKYPGVTFQEKAGKGSSDMLKMHIEVKNALGSRFGHSEYDDFNNFLVLLGRIMPRLFQDERKDHVVAPHYPHNGGFLTSVYESFQRWLNTQDELDERVALEVLQAMAVPFGHEQEKAVKREFRPSFNMARAAFFGIAVYTDDFSVYSSDDLGANQKEGSVQWNWARLATIGASYGVEDDNRKWVDVSLEHGPSLYEMSPMDVECSQQSLSLLLGIGAMAYRARQYAGREDILAGARWS